MQRSLKICLFLMLGVGSVAGDEFGDITATFILDGNAPAPKKLDTAKEQMCTEKDKMLFDETLTVNKDNKGIRDVVAYLFLKPGEAAPAMHPDQEKSREQPVELQNLGCRFVPRISLVMTNQTLVVKNPDPFGHNTNITLFENPSQNPNLPAGAKVEFKFTKAEKRPAPVACNIHPWMGGYILVKDHPFMGVTDGDGKLTIKNVPTGSRTFQLWHGSYISTAKQNGKAVKWDKGMVKIDVKPGTNDLGEIKIEPKHFQSK